MSQYAKLKAQIADLQAQADDVRRQEVAAVIAEVQQKIAEYGLTADLLRGASEARASAEEAPLPEIPRSEVGRERRGKPNGSSVKPRSFPHRMTESPNKRAASRCGFVIRANFGADWITAYFLAAFRVRRRRPGAMPVDGPCKAIRKFRHIAAPWPSS